MSSFRRIGQKSKPPAGWEEVLAPQIAVVDRKMKEAQSASHEGKRIAESTWPIIQLHHQKSRIVYEAFYQEKSISKELYDWCLDRSSGPVADRDLIAKWKRPGYERLCCLRCIQPQETNFGTVCVCRVPRSMRASSSSSEKPLECVHCGCHGCSG